jgi:four helix bundle protein
MVCSDARWGMSIKSEFELWEREVPLEITSDPLWHCTAYKLALFAADWAWSDLTALAGDRRTAHIADQLGRSLGGISSNYIDAYSRSSPGDRCRFYEYSLGEAREARGWYFKGRHIIEDERLHQALELLTRIVQLLTVTIVRERGRYKRPKGKPKVDDDA